ncbi:MAG: hypothetical protein KBC84_03050 [Proteobacteria bacterium]|nr:hypothetical protein [Pseudomonadota bacterium]
MRDLLPQGLEVSWGILVSTPIFIMFFSCLFIWVFGNKRKETYSKIENLPLEN